MSKSYLSEIEKGKKTPTISILEKISSSFNIPLSTLIILAENLELFEQTEGAIQTGKIPEIVKLILVLRFRQKSARGEKLSRIYYK